MFAKKMETFGRHRKRRDIAAAVIMLLAALPFLIFALHGLAQGEGRNPLVIGFFILSGLAILAAGWILVFGRRHLVVITPETVERREPFRSQRIAIADLKAVAVGNDGELILKTERTSLLVPWAIFGDQAERIRFRSSLERLAPRCDLSRLRQSEWT